jgi:hypothetical protein
MKETGGIFVRDCMEGHNLEEKLKSINAFP